MVDVHVMPGDERHAGASGLTSDILGCALRRQRSPGRPQIKAVLACHECALLEDLSCEINPKP